MKFEDISEEASKTICQPPWASPFHPDYNHIMEISGWIGIIKRVIFEGGTSIKSSATQPNLNHSS
jgi:hypothetical protein